ncbi:hypothetical protein GG344DRAFT_80638 [Lentinula edodes]|nr:hypothetical protein GG344DRAFT_80638 [Lentinula edodes]
MFRTTHAPTPTTTPHKLLYLLTVLSSISFFLANALPIDLSTSNSSSSSSPESLGIRTPTPENAKQANFLLGYTYENTEVGTDYNIATQFTPAHHFEVGALGTIGKYLSPRPAQIHELKPGATMEVRDDLQLSINEKLVSAIQRREQKLSSLELPLVPFLELLPPF